MQLDDGQRQTTSGTSATFYVGSGSYVAKVRAVVAGSGSSGWTTSNAAGPWSAPGKPSVQQAAGGVSVSWSSAGTGARVSYTVNVRGDTSTSIDTGTSTSAFVPLSPGNYTISITASHGGSSAESPSTDFKVTGSPNPPSSPVIAASGASGALDVVTPAYASAGGGWSAGELRVEYSIDGGASWTGSTHFTGLWNGRGYTVSARVVAPDGSVSSSTTGNTARPYGPPGAPTVSCAPSGTSVRCTFTPGDTGGQAVTYEQADSSDGAGAGPVSEGYVKVIDPGAGRSATWCVRASNGAGTTAWSCDSATAGGASRSFYITTDTPEAQCTQQDLDETGFRRNFCWRIVVDVSGFSPNSSVSCSYDYRDRADGQIKRYTGSVTVDSSGGGRKVFPHRSAVPDLQVTCTQQ